MGPGLLPRALTQDACHSRSVSEIRLMRVPDRNLHRWLLVAPGPTRQMGQSQLERTATPLAQRPPARPGPPAGRHPGRLRLELDMITVQKKNEDVFADVSQRANRQRAAA